MRTQQVEHFLLGVPRAVFLNENPLGDFAIEPVLLGEIRQQMVVDLDPVRRVERLQPDAEEFRRAVIGRVGG